MLTGMNLLLWTGHVTAQYFPLFDKLKKAGFDGVELPLFEGDLAHYKMVGEELKHHGLRCTTVTIANADTNPVSPDAKIRKAAVDRVNWAIEMTAALDGENLCGAHHSPIR